MKKTKQKNITENLRVFVSFFRVICNVNRKAFGARFFYRVDFTQVAKLKKEHLPALHPHLCLDEGGLRKINLYLNGLSLSLGHLPYPA